LRTWQGNISNIEPHVVAFKATSEKEGAPCKELPIDPSKLGTIKIDKKDAPTSCIDLIDMNSPL
jgi:hypothetical protein